MKEEARGKTIRTKTRLKPSWRINAHYMLSERNVGICELSVGFGWYRALGLKWVVFPRMPGLLQEGLKWHTVAEEET